MRILEIRLTIKAAENKPILSVDRLLMIPMELNNIASALTMEHIVEIKPSISLCERMFGRSEAIQDLIERRREQGVPGTHTFFKQLKSACDAGIFAVLPPFSSREAETLRKEATNLSTR